LRGSSRKAAELNLAEKLDWLKGSAQSNTSYIVEVNANESLAPYILSYAGKSGITITLTGSERIISLSKNGVLFKVQSGVTLILDNNITLQGRSNNNDCLITVDEGGTLEMKTGSKITGNKAKTGGGVFVDDKSNSIFRIVNGTVYGSGEKDLSNTAKTGAALFYNKGTAQLGTFNGTTWASSNSLTTTAKTIKVVNGVLP